MKDIKIHIETFKTGLVFANSQYLEETKISNFENFSIINNVYGSHPVSRLNLNIFISVIMASIIKILANIKVITKTD